MAFVTPQPGTAGQVYTAAAHNVIVDNLNTIRALQLNAKYKNSTYVANVTSSVNTYTAVPTDASTGKLEVVITPSTTSSLILVMYSVSVGVSTGAHAQARVTRNGTAVGVAASAGSRGLAGAANYIGDGGRLEGIDQIFVDAPATTSACTYQVQLTVSNAATVYVNRTGNDPDSASGPRGHSSIFVCEIPA